MDSRETPSELDRNDLNVESNPEEDSLDAVVLESLARAGGLPAERIDKTLNCVVIGKVVEVGEAVLVDYPGNQSKSAIEAVTVTNVGQQEVGRGVVLAFGSGNRGRPIVLGVIQDQGSATGKNTEPSSPEGVEAQVDGERITLTAQNEIVLKCGKASITLTKAGKVLIRGAYLLNRSSGVNRIKGGSVQIN
jgi:hypothetical protein